jgi:SdrD B-like domain
LAASVEPKLPTANLPLANFLSMQIEKRTYASHTLVNLLCTLSIQPKLLVIIFIMRVQHLQRIIIVSIFFLLAQATNAQVSGKVFRDFNANGLQTTAAPDPVEPGLAGVVVNAYDAGGGPYTATTGANGSYSISGGTGPYRVEFILPAYHYASNGSVSNTTIQFVAAGGAANLGVNTPNEYCQANPNLAVPCYIAGAYNNPSNSSLDALVSFSANKSGDGTVAGNMPNHDATFGQVGATWGLAYQRSTRKLFASALQKRHVGFGSLGPGGIYQVDYSSGTAVTTNWLDVNTLAGVNVGTDPHTGLGAYTVRTNDPTSFDAAGKIAIGNLEISQDDQYLYAVNLNNKEILKIRIADKTLVSRTAIPNPGCTNSSNKILKLINFGVAADANAHFSGFISGAPFVTLGSGTSLNYIPGYDPNTTSAPYIVYSGIQFGDPINVDVPIANGTYKVTLYWRTNDDAVGDRIMNVNMEGSTVDNNLLMLRSHCAFVNIS